MPSRRLFVSCGCAAALALPAAAVAQAPGLSVTLSPPTAKQGSKLKLTLDGAGLGDTGGQPPTSVRLLTQAGFAFDATAVKGRCAVGATTCPANAKIGSGSAQAAYSFLGLSGNATADAQAFLTRPTQAGDLAGVVIVADIPALGRKISIGGRVLRAAAPDGLELRFDDLLSGAGIPAGVSVTLQRLTITAAATRTTTKTKTVRRKGKRVKVKVKTKRSLIINPKTCSRAWTARGIVGLADGRERALPVSIPCRR